MKATAATVGRLVISLAVLVGAQDAPAQSTPDRFFDSNGMRIRYQVWGQGLPVVLLHGFGETLDSWHRGDVIRVLSRHFQVIVMDVRGHGRSSKSHDPKTYGTELSADVVRLLRHTGKPKAHIVGYSMGALVALDFAVLHRAQVLSIVLVGAGWISPETLSEFERLAEGYERGNLPVRDGDDPKALAAFLRSLRVLPEEEVRRIPVPIAALIGTDDRFMADVNRLSRVLPELRLNVIEGANHATTPNHPKFAQILFGILLRRSDSPQY